MEDEDVDNKKSRKEINADYYKRNKGKAAQARDKYRAENREAYNAYMREYRRKRREKAKKEGK